MKTFSKVFLSLLFFSSVVQAAATQAPDLKITSLDLKPNKAILSKHVFNGFGCSGDNISPQIAWADAPKDTKSFAVTVYDPDAPTGSGWWHWLVVNIPVTYSELPQNFGSDNQFKLKDDVTQIRNDFGLFKFGGPCPPPGAKPHRYVFTVFALKVDKLDLHQDATPALAGFMINQNILDKAQFTATYGR